MCGIAGYIGAKNVDQVLIVALERLKYRGYDSAGMAVFEDGAIVVRKAAGKLKNLADRIEGQPISAHWGIAHTRWATHGAATEVNAHPHVSADGRIAVVHNGIVENHEELRAELQAKGVRFVSQTDTEVIPQLLASLYAGDPLAAMRAALARLRGQFSFAAMFAGHPDRILAARNGGAILVGRGKKEALIASDLPALLPHAHESLYLEDGQIADVEIERVAIWNADGTAAPARFAPIELTADAVSKGEFDSFMAKEIAEQPQILTRLLESRLHGGRLVQPDLGIDLAAVQHVVFLACGTSWHAAMLGKRFLEALARVHVEVDISSEYRYRNPVASGDTLVVAISQSGETADTLAGLRLARAKFMPVVSLVNLVTSTIARESNGVMPLLAGPEIGVASTKAYTAQVLALYLFALQVARAKRLLSQEAEETALSAARLLGEQAAETLAICEEPVAEAADLFTSAEASVFLGRGGEHSTALEGALKLKEVAYIHAIGYPAGEFKHGPIALVTRQLPVICICPQDSMYDKMLSSLQEVRARAGRIITVGQAGDRALLDLGDHLFPIARAKDELLQPILSILPLQRYAYHIARRRDCDVDQPRNLAKSVTVE